jgi:DNA-directed RNA polymerase I subunit RPA49
VNEVYPLSSLIGDTARNDLQGIARQLLMVNENFRKSKLSELILVEPSATVAQYTERGVLALGTSNEELGRAVLLLYYHFLLVLSRQRESSLSSPGALSRAIGCPLSVAIEILHQFCDTVVKGAGKSKFTVSPRTKSKIRCYMFIIALHLESFHLNLGLLTHDFALSISKLSDLARLVGCVVDQAGQRDQGFTMLAGAVSQTRRAILKAPLVIPDSLRTKKKTSTNRR